MTISPGFLLRIVCCSQSGHHPENNFSQIWLYTRYEKYKKNRIWVFLFAMKNPLFRSKSLFSGFLNCLKGERDHYSQCLAE